MPLTVQLAVLVVAQTAILLIPWIVLWRTYYHPEPDLVVEHARTAWAARWFLGWPATIGLVAAGAWWIEHDHSLLLVGYLALITRVVVFFATNARRSMPALGWVYPWLVGPVLAYAAVLLVDSYVWPSSGRGWLGWLVVVVAAMFGPPQAVALVATVLRPPLLAAKRLLSVRRLRGRWLRSGGDWVLCDVWQHEQGAVLWFTTPGAILPLPSGERPHFSVFLTRDPDWNLPPGVPRTRLADQAGPGPIRQAQFSARGGGRRAAVARLDEELVVEVEEVRIGGDDFFAFVASLQPTGRPDRPPDRRPRRPRT